VGSGSGSGSENDYIPSNKPRPQAQLIPSVKPLLQWMKDVQERCLLKDIISYAIADSGQTVTFF